MADAHEGSPMRRIVMPEHSEAERLMVAFLKLSRLNVSPWQSPYDRTSTGLAFCSLCPLTRQTY
jgi:hypothetical protein